ncbi:hypothetical protein AYO44_15765 [Planctomycetaceae bacterium SCGC AG-212-F19]|nr:hypothetical protein AYO44_15765 [Planctomycetaceae bacterium SCGC AG-212-F19]
MLTPAEELGLSGLSLASRVRKAFYKIPEPELVELMQRIREAASRRHLIYLRDGEPDVIHVMPCPLTALPDQITYIHYVTLTVQNALKRLLELYMQDFTVRDILRLPPDEEKWLWDCWSPSQRENNPIFGRHDAVVDFLSPMWKETLRFVEPNMSSIGGLHLVPTAERIIAEQVLPLLKAQDPELQLEVGQDIRELLMQEVRDHLEALGRPARNICFIDPKYDGSGPDEQEALAQYYHERYGLKVMHADPAELTFAQEEVVYNGDVVDLVYRDYSVADLLELERTGVSIEPMRSLFRQNRVISSITAELDQKSCWEVLTDSQLTQKYFTADERQVFRRHLLWTRILSDRRTQLPDGQFGDLLEYVRHEHETLVLKPNRSYGGEGVQLGCAMDRSEWESALERVLADTERWVVQQLATIPVSEFPVVGPDGKVHVEPFYTVMGFAPSKYGMATLGRASQKQVVNVAQRGGMCTVFLGRPPRGLIGPQPSSQRM